LDIALFTLVAILLYLFSDWLLGTIEKKRGAVFKNRNIIFFAIILVLTMGSFELMQWVLQSNNLG